MTRAVLVLGCAIVLVIGGGVAFLLAGGATPELPGANERRETDSKPREPRSIERPLDAPSPAPEIDEELVARLARWREAVSRHEAGRAVAALEIVAEIREEDSEFLAEPERARIVLAMEDAALALVQEAIDARRLVTAKALSSALQGLVVDPQRLDTVLAKLADTTRQLAAKQGADARRLLARTRNKKDRRTLGRHLDRFGPPRRARTRIKPEGVDRSLEAVAKRNEADPEEPLPVPDIEEAEKRRMEQLEKLRQRNAVGLLDHIASGLAWLALHQGDDGCISESTAKARCGALEHTPCVSSDSARYPVASTALAVIAFLDFRDQDAQGLFEPALARGVDWLLAQQKRDGSFPHKRMYSHAIAVMALGQAAAASDRPDLRNAVERGLAWIAAKPGPTGGYRYRLGQAGDLSVTGWVVQGYEMAGLCGAKVPDGFAGGLRTFWTTVWLGDGRFSYLSGGTERRNLAPVGMLMAHLVEHPTAPEMRPVWRQKLETWPGRPSLYALYYGVRMLLALDGKLPKKWNDWVFQLARNQTTKGPAAGSFPAKGGWKLGANELTTRTAFSVLTLEHSLYRR